MADTPPAKSTPPRKPAGPQIHEDRDNITASGITDKVGSDTPVPVWEEPDAPRGSTSESLLDYDRNGNPIGVAGPTHYAHLGNGQVIAHYSGGTHHTTGDDSGDPSGDTIIPVVARFGA